ncbi:MAG TPA: HPr family phosphocarrier protein [Ktedonobacterales bacterium]
MTSNELTLTHEAGLHARPAAQFVKTANRFASTITVQAGGKKANAKSIVQVLTLGARQGTVITVTAEGADEAGAIAALTALVEGNFAAE